MKRSVVLAWILVGLWPAAHGGKGKTTEIEIESPPSGKAVVYVGRMTGYVGRARPFHIFHNEEYVTFLKGKNYLRIVCEPGENLFWVAAENRSFVTADLEAGKSYAIFAKLGMGAWSARAELLPITKESDAWKEFSGMLGHKPPKEPDEKHLKKWYTNHPDYIEKALAEWETQGKPALTLRSDEFLD